MLISAGDQKLLARQAALQAEAARVLAELDLGHLLGDVGPVLVVGSYLSGLMCWHRLPSYPDEVSGWEIYTAVLRDGVRTPEQFGHWLAANGYPGPDGTPAGDGAV